MRANWAQRVAAFLLAFAALLTAAPAVQATTLQVACDEEKRGSYLVEITAAAFKRAGYDTEFVYLPWARALAGAEAGVYPVLMGAYYTEERARKLLYSAPIGSVDVYFWKLANTPIPYERLEDMKPYLIGFIRGSSISPEFDLALKQYLRVDYVSQPELNLQHLLMGRIDAFVEKKEMVDQLLAHLPARDAARVVPMMPPLKIGKFYNTFSRAVPQFQALADAFAAGLKQIRDDGTERAILQRHGKLPSSAGSGP